MKENGSLANKCFHNRHGVCHLLNGPLGECIGSVCHDWVSWDKEARKIVNSLLPKHQKIKFNEHVDRNHLMQAGILEMEIPLIIRE
jgi:hypothetical protein